MHKEFIVQGFYSNAYKWEDLTAENNRIDAKKRMNEYDLNEPEFPHRIVKREVD